MLAFGKNGEIRDRQIDIVVSESVGNYTESVLYFRDIRVPIFRNHDFKGSRNFSTTKFE